jgi:hypothetical protein
LVLFIKDVKDLELENTNSYELKNVFRWRQSAVKPQIKTYYEKKPVPF